MQGYDEKNEVQFLKIQAILFVAIFHHCITSICKYNPIM